jgi:hypothetical protein
MFSKEQGVVGREGDFWPFLSFDWRTGLRTLFSILFSLVVLACKGLFLSLARVGLTKKSP